MILGYQEIPDHTALSLVSFSLTDQNDDQIYQINLKNKKTCIVKVKVVANIEPQVLSSLQNDSIARVYMNVSSPDAKGAYLVSQHIQLPISELKLDNNNLVRLTYQFEVPKKLVIHRESVHTVYDISAIDITLAYSNKRSSEMGNSEATRIGTFLITRISVKS